jgi:hypothetical protein
MHVHHLLRRRAGRADATRITHKGAHVSNTVTAQATPKPRSGLWKALKIVAAITPLLVLVQAFLAGRGVFADNEYINGDYIGIHGFVANIILLVAIAQAVLAYLALARGYTTRAMLGVSIAIVVLVVVQIGLGYAGDDGGNAAAWHIPNGVLIMALSIVGHMLTRTPAGMVRATR